MSSIARPSAEQRAFPMPDRRLLPIAKAAELAETGLCGAKVSDVDLVVVGCEGGIRVFEGRCLHQGTLLSEGALEGGALVCRAHGWRYSTDTGEKLDEPSRCLSRLEGVVEGDEIF